jgi:hypothetical protein
VPTACRADIKREADHAQALSDIPRARKRPGIGICGGEFALLSDEVKERSMFPAQQKQRAVDLLKAIDSTKPEDAIP